MYKNLKKALILGVIGGCLSSISLSASEYDMPRFLFGYSLLPTDVQEKAKHLVEPQPADEVAFLLNLTKDQREIYRSLDQQDKQVALELANQPEYRGSCQGACRAVDRAVQHRMESNYRESREMLHNGMGRREGSRGQY